MGADEQSMCAFPEGVDRDGLARVVRGECRIAGVEPHLAEALERTQVDVGHAPPEVVEPVRLLARQEAPARDGPCGEGPARGTRAVAIGKGDLGTMDGLCRSVEIDP